MNNKLEFEKEERYNLINNFINQINSNFLEEEKQKENILKNILPKIFPIIKEIKEEMKKYPPQICILNTTNLQRYENYNSKLIFTLLNIDINYKDIHLSFSKEFLKFLNKKFKWNYGFNNIKEIDKIDCLNIEIEKYVEGRRIDLFVSYKKEFAIIIENKIYAVEQPNQLEDYYNGIEKEGYKNIFLIFLTPSGYEPQTLSKKLIKKLNNGFQTMQHRDIAKWLEEILYNNKYSFLHSENILFEDKENKYIKDYRLLKSAMIQTIYNANMISNNTEEYDVTTEKIRNLLEQNNILKNLTTIEEIKEYKEIFNKINNVLDEKIKEIELKKLIDDVWNFNEKICIYFKSKNISNYKQLEKEKFEYAFRNNVYIRHIELPVSNDINIVLESNYMEDYTCFGIITSNENKKCEIKKLDQEIKNKFSGLREYTQSADWVYLGDINIYTDSPELIAKAMIQIYNILKDDL